MQRRLVLLNFGQRRAEALLRELGTPLKVAQVQLDRSHLSTTLEVYTHASGGALRQVVDQLENQLFPNVPKFSTEEQIPGGLIQ